MSAEPGQGTTHIPSIDEITEAVSVIQDQPFFNTESFGPSYSHYLSYRKVYRCPFSTLIRSRELVVEQDAVMEGRTDMQGICWREGIDAKRKYRDYRDHVHPPAYVNNPDEREIQEVRDDLDYEGNEYFRFRYTDTKVHCSHRHPQLRNLVCATSKNDIYYLYNNSIQHWCPQLQSTKAIPGPNMNSRERITTMAAKDNILLTGGEDGSLTFVNLDTCKNPILDSSTNGDTLEVNGIEISHSRTGRLHAFVSTNDRVVKCLNMDTLKTYATYDTDWFVNYTSQSPDGHMIGLVGDNDDAKVMSVNSRETIATLTGHQRYSFSVAWSPDSTKIATGSDDCSTYIYDTRKMTDPLHILSKDIQYSVRSLRYSPCGRYLIMAEDRNFVHIVDTASDYKQAQKIDVIGDISGISLTPDGDSLFVGISNTVEFSSILEFEKIHTQSSGDWMYEDSMWDMSRL